MIPARLHFCWIGPSLSWVHVFAVLSAADRSGMDEIVLHHTDALADGEELRAIGADKRVRLARTDPLAYLVQTGHLLGVGDALARLYGTLERRVMQADVLRAAILYTEGGIYMDLDTVTVASLCPLLGASVFVGAERIVWPDSVRRSRSPLVWAHHLALDGVRKALRALPGGWAPFRRLEFLYPRSVNNAVMGAALHAPFFAAMLREMLAAQSGGGSRYALGPHLLQLMAARRGGDLVVHDPAVFYPLAPEISRHWFRIGGRPRLDRVLSAETRIVHWYASVGTAAAVASITPQTVRRDRHRQLYSALVWSCIDTLPAAAGGAACLQDRSDLRTGGSTVLSSPESSS